MAQFHSASYLPSAAAVAGNPMLGLGVHGMLQTALDIGKIDREFAV
jgi:hypothetical protein